MELGDTFILVCEDTELRYHNQCSYDATGWVIRGANPSRCKKFFSSLIKSPYQFWGLPGLQFNEYWVLLHGLSGQCMRS